MLTNKSTKTSIKAWLDAALADGWTSEDTGDKTYWRIERAKFKVAITMRPKVSPSVNAWAPDGLSLQLPDVYDWKQLKANTVVCQHCGAVGRVTRLAFCNRACPSCREKLAPTLEAPGWAD